MHQPRRPRIRGQVMADSLVSARTAGDPHMTTGVVSGGPVSVGRPSHSPVLAVIAVLLGCFVVSFDTRLFAIGLPDLRGAFGLSFDEGSWLATISTTPQILIAPALPWLATVFGLRRVL